MMGNDIGDFLDQEGENYQINILPMIDIIFVILSFFIISSLFLVKLETIPVNLPNAESSNIEKDSVIIISMDVDNKIYIDKRLINLNSLENVIKSKIKNISNKKVVLRADKELKYGNVISVLDILRKIENIKIGVSTEP